MRAAKAQINVFDEIIVDNFAGSGGLWHEMKPCGRW